MPPDLMDPIPDSKARKDLLSKHIVSPELEGRHLRRMRVVNDRSELVVIALSVVVLVGIVVILPFTLRDPFWFVLWKQAWWKGTLQDWSIQLMILSAVLAGVGFPAVLVHASIQQARACWDRPIDQLGSTPPDDFPGTQN